MINKEENLPCVYLLFLYLMSLTHFIGQGLLSPIMDDVVFVSPAMTETGRMDRTDLTRRRAGAGVQRIGDGMSDMQREQEFFDNQRNGAFRSFYKALALVFCSAASLFLFVYLITQIDRITYRNISGVSYKDADNFEHPFGIDNGSSIFVHPVSESKTVEFCREDGHTGTYYSPGQETGLPAVTGVHTMRFETICDTGDFAVCLDFDRLDLKNAFPATCSQGDFIRFTNVRTIGIDGTMFCQKEHLPFEKICSVPRRLLEVQFSSTTGETAPGWRAKLECGYPGCTQQAYSNYQAEATVDRRSCVSNSGEEDEMVVCGEPGRFYDSGGPGGNYRNNELQGTRFQSGKEGHRTCIEIVRFELAPNGDGACTSDLLTLKNYRLGVTGPVQDDATFCNSTGNTPPMGTPLCQVDWETPLQFDFISNGAQNAPGWEIIVTCSSTVS